MAIIFDPLTLTYRHHTVNGWATYKTCGSCARELGLECVKEIHMGRGTCDQVRRMARAAASWAIKWLDGNRGYWGNR